MSKIELVVYKRDAKGRKILNSKRISLSTTGDNVAWLAQRLDEIQNGARRRDAAKRAKAAKRAAAQAQQVA